MGQSRHGWLGDGDKKDHFNPQMSESSRSDLVVGVGAWKRQESTINLTVKADKEEFGTAFIKPHTLAPYTGVETLQNCVTQSTDILCFPEPAVVDHYPYHQLEDKGVIYPPSFDTVEDVMQDKDSVLDVDNALQMTRSEVLQLEHTAVNDTYEVDKVRFIVP